MSSSTDETPIKELKETLEHGSVSADHARHHMRDDASDTEEEEEEHGFCAECVWYAVQQASEGGATTSEDELLQEDLPSPPPPSTSKRQPQQEEAEKEGKEQEATEEEPATEKHAGDKRKRSGPASSVSKKPKIKVPTRRKPEEWQQQQQQRSAVARPEVLRETEGGACYFFYRPRVGLKEAKNASDVAHCYMMLVPDKKDTARLLKIPSKKMPKAGSRSSHKLLFVAKAGSVQELIEYLGQQTTTTPVTKEQHTFYPARLAAAGFYSLFLHNHEGSPPSGMHAHLGWRLVAPRRMGPAQKMMNLVPEATSVVVVHNPARGTWLGIKCKLPEELQDQFKGKRVDQRKNIPLDPPEFLEQEGLEVLLVGNKPQLEPAGPIKDNLLAFAEAHSEAVRRETGNLEEYIFAELGMGEEFSKVPLYEGRIV